MHKSLLNITIQHDKEEPYITYRGVNIFIVPIVNNYDIYIASLVNDKIIVTEEIYQFTDDVKKVFIEHEIGHLINQHNNEYNDQQQYLLALQYAKSSKVVFWMEKEADDYAISQCGKDNFIKAMKLLYHYTKVKYPESDLINIDIRIKRVEHKMQYIKNIIKNKFKK